MIKNHKYNSRRYHSHHSQVETIKKIKVTLFLLNRQTLIRAHQKPKYNTLTDIIFNTSSTQFIMAVTKNHLNSSRLILVATPRAQQMRTSTLMSPYCLIRLSSKSRTLTQIQAKKQLRRLFLENN